MIQPLIKMPYLGAICIQGGLFSHMRRACASASQGDRLERWILNSAEKLLFAEHHLQAKVICAGGLALPAAELC